MSSPRAMLYVQHLLGIGHLKRAATLSRALTDEAVAVTLVSGGAPVAGLDAGGAEILQLPPAHSIDDGTWQLLDETGDPVDDGWRTRRRDALLDCFARTQPDVLIVEMFPFGRRQMRFELLPLLDAATNAPKRPLIVCSVRDILQINRRPGRAEGIAALVERYFDHVLVHGDPTFVPFEETFAATDRIRDRLTYTGYVTGPPADAVAGAGEILVSSGGGAVGAHLLRTAMAARPITGLGQSTWRLLAGHNMADAAFAALQGAAPDGVIVERARTDFAARLAGCRVSVSQAGYNTVADALAANASMVLVPFASDGETEQTTRANKLAALGRAQVIAEDALAPESLADAIDSAATPRSQPASDRLALDVSGAETSARLIAHWLGGERRMEAL